MVRMIIVGYYIDSDSYGIDSDGNECVTSSDNMSLSEDTGDRGYCEIRSSCW